MNASLILVVLATLVASFNAASLSEKATRTDLNVGYVRPGDVLLNRSYLQRYAQPNAIQSQDLIYRGNSTTRIHAVFVREVGYTQFANAWIVSGGINQSAVTVRAQSARGYGYYYDVQIWGVYR